MDRPRQRVDCPDCHKSVAVNIMPAHRRSHMLPWDKVDISGDCWEWTGPMSRSGYGLASHITGQRYAHRLFFTAFVGQIPVGYEVDHLCRNSGCVRPSHLDAVTPQENKRRGLMGRITAQEQQTHCKRGHEFTPENILRRPSAPHVRACRTCNQEQHLEWRRKEKAAREAVA